MRFHLPLDDVQWNTAAKHYNSMRAYLRRLRKDYPPVSVAQRDILKRLRESMGDFGREVLQPRDKIDPSRLNQSSTEMARAAIDYIAAHNAPPR
jgi:hypothetical protein